MSDKKWYHLFSTEVIAISKEKQRFGVKFNVLVPSENKYVNLRELSMAQQESQVRFFKEIDPEMTSTVADVFIANINNMGLMSEAQWLAGMETTQPIVADIVGSDIKVEEINTNG